MGIFYRGVKRLTVITNKHICKHISATGILENVRTSFEHLEPEMAVYSFANHLKVGKIGCRASINIHFQFLPSILTCLHVGDVLKEMYSCNILGCSKFLRSKSLSIPTGTCCFTFSVFLTLFVVE